MDSQQRKKARNIKKLIKNNEAIALHFVNSQDPNVYLPKKPIYKYKTSEPPINPIQKVKIIGKKLHGLDRKPQQKRDLIKISRPISISKLNKEGKLFLKRMFPNLSWDKIKDFISKKSFQFLIPILKKFETSIKKNKNIINLFKIEKPHFLPKDSPISIPRNSLPLAIAPVPIDRISSTPRNSSPLAIAPVPIGRRSSTPRNSSPLALALVPIDRISSTPRNSSPLAIAPSPIDRISSTPRNSSPLAIAPVPIDRISSTPRNSSPLAIAPVPIGRRSSTLKKRQSSLKPAVQKNAQRISIKNPPPTSSDTSSCQLNQKDGNFDIMEKVFDIRWTDLRFLTPEEKKKLLTKYRKCALKYHPDKGGNQQIFKKLNNVNKLISDNLPDNYLEILEGWAQKQNKMEELKDIRSVKNLLIDLKKY